MALQPAQTLVRKKLPYLSDDDNTDVDCELVVQAYVLQPYIQLVDADVELYDDVAKWKPVAKLLLVDLAAYHMLHAKVLANQAGVNGAKPKGQKTLKKAKADVVEAEFMMLSSKDGNSVQINTTELLGNLKMAICQKAKSCGFTMHGYCPEEAPVAPCPPVKFYGVDPPPTPPENC